MSEQFKVGEVCIGQNHVVTTRFNGMECEIIDGLAPRHFRDKFNNMKETWSVAYMVLWANGETTYAEPPRLRRRPPKQDYTSWANAKVKQVTKPVNIPQPEKEIA